MQWQMLRTAVLRLSAFATLLVSIMCCAGPTETFEAASEAMIAIPPLNPSPNLTVAPRPTAEELAQMEQLVRDNLPKWKVYANGHDSYDAGSRGERGGLRYFGHPRDLDQHCLLVLIPEGGDRQPERWTFLRYERYWLRGPAYFTEELKLSVLDVLGILLALGDAGPEPPQLWSRKRLHEVESLKYEDGPHGVLPPVPPDWGRDEHTWTGGPPSAVPRPHPPSRPPPNSGPLTGQMTPLPPSKSLEEIWNGLAPTDEPAGRYPGWNRPHPGEKWERFRCGGKVYEGYRSDCPDFQRKPIGERWTKRFEDLARDLANNAGHTLDLIRADPDCVTLCKAAVVLPSIISGTCLASERFLGAVPHPYARVLLVFCEIFRVFKDPIVVGAGLGAAQFGPDWCKESFCHPPSNSGQGRER